jgi:hypothetical protein
MKTFGCIAKYTLLVIAYSLPPLAWVAKWCVGMAFLCAWTTGPFVIVDYLGLPFWLGFIGLGSFLYCVGKFGGGGPYDPAVGGQ